MSEEVQNNQEHEGAHEMEHLKSHIKTYWTVFWLLILGTVLTVGVPYIWFSETHAWNVLLGLAIATAKGFLVCYFFMHLNAERKLVYWMIVLAVFGALALFILTALAYWDHTLTFEW